MRRSIRLLAMLLIGTLSATSSGCAVYMAEENRVVLNALDERVQPETTAGKVALAPVILPVSLLAAGVDGLIINPAVALPNATRDTYEAFWDGSHPEPLVAAMLLPVKVVLTPPGFLFFWTTRAMLHPRDERRPQA